MTRGFFKLFTVRGTAFRVHWSTPIVAFLAGGTMSHWFVFALGIIIPIHELGHAFVMRRFGMRVVAIDVHGAGGVCRGVGYTTDVQRSIIAWGGVLAQLVIGAVCLAAGNEGFFETLAQVNVLLIVVNLLPLPILDGWEAWQLFRPRNVRAFFASRRRASARARAERDRRNYLN